MDRLAQLLITVSRLDMEKLHPVARFAELLKFFGLLIVVSIGLIVGSIEIGWLSCNRASGIPPFPYLLLHH